MFNLFIPDKIVQMPDSFDTIGKGSLDIHQLQVIRNNLLDRNLGKYNGLSQVSLCPISQNPVQYQKLAIKAYDQSISKKYEQIMAINDGKHNQGVQILLARHMRLSRDILASKATRLQKLQSGFKTLAAQKKSRDAKSDLVQNKYRK